MATSSSLSSKVAPKLHGGYNKQHGEPFNNLEGVVFDSRCPPDVAPDTIIVVVCGPNDFGDNAAPSKDGWLVSKFYMFHHLFRDTATEQHWLTCLDPRDLVEKYKEYVHGNPTTEDRKVVLDNSMLAEVMDVLVVDGNGKDLLDRFPSCLADAFRQVKGTERRILALVFGHGTRSTFSITLGGTEDPVHCPTLTIDHIKKALYRNDPCLNLAMLKPSPFGGGWTQTPKLNISAMSGTDLQSWTMSALSGQVCGSRYATGVARALIRKEIKGLVLASDDGDTLLSSHTFAALAKSIHDVLKEEVDVRGEYTISFSAKDDLWGSQWQARTGFPLANYQAKWDALKSVPTGAYYTGKSMTGSVRFSDAVTLTTPEAEFQLKRLASTYLACKPGPGSAAKNHFTYSTCNRLLDGIEFGTEILEKLAGALQYRLYIIMDRATDYKDRLGLVFPDCRDCDVEVEKPKVVTDPEKQFKYSKIRKMLHERELFDIPCGNDGHAYSKGVNYLTLALVKSEWSRERVEEALEVLEKLRVRLSRYDITVRTLRFWEDRGVRELLGTIAKSTQIRLRSLSPTKHPRKSSDSAFGNLEL
ncbi:hypothetical protein MMC19_004134 [Ptychographa xylographoides]|nr:hypothetical protein [Ptychographa xylographoides]